MESDNAARLLAQQARDSRLSFIVSVSRQSCRHGDLLRSGVSKLRGAGDGERIPAARGGLAHGRTRPPRAPCHSDSDTASVSEAIDPRTGRIIDRSAKQVGLALDVAFVFSECLGN